MLKSIIKDTIQLLREFFRFILSPDPSLPVSAWNSATLLRAVLASFVVLMIGVALSLVMSFVGEGITLQAPNSENQSLMHALPAWVFLIAAGITGPVGEELFLRLPLKPHWKNLLISFCAGVCMLLFFNHLAVTKIYFQQPLSFEFSRFVPAIIVLFISSVYYVLPADLQQNKIVFALLFYLLAFTFGVLHRFEAIHSPFDVLLAFRDTSLQFFAGLYFSFLRMKYGIRLSIISHSFWNLFPAVGQFIKVAAWL